MAFWLALGGWLSFSVVLGELRYFDCYSMFLIRIWLYNIWKNFVKCLDRYCERHFLWKDPHFWVWGSIPMILLQLQPISIIFIFPIITFAFPEPTIMNHDVILLISKNINGLSPLVQFQRFILCFLLSTKPYLKMDFIQIQILWAKNTRTTVYPQNQSEEVKIGWLYIWEG